MRLLDSITVRHPNGERFIMLFVGDLAAIPESEAVDYLVVSAFPGDYAETTGALIGALARKGVSVGRLAANKEVDLLRFSSCWLSRPVSAAGFRRILCFEPAHRSVPAEVVGDIFRSIVPFVGGPDGPRQIAMPLVAAGDRGESPGVMLDALTRAAVHWLAGGLALDRIKIVVHNPALAEGLAKVFAQVKAQLDAATPKPPPASCHDVFISYSWKNKTEADLFLAALSARKPSLKVFLDRQELKTGMDYVKHLFDALEGCRKVICLFSPDYLQSSMCQEEFNVARLRHRESSGGVLLPVYLKTADLPAHMRIYQYTDAREGDQAAVSTAAGQIASLL